MAWNCVTRSPAVFMIVSSSGKGMIASVCCTLKAVIILNGPGVDVNGNCRAGQHTTTRQLCPSLYKALSQSDRVGISDQMQMNSKSSTCQATIACSKIPSPPHLPNPDLPNPEEPAHSRYLARKEKKKIRARLSPGAISETKWDSNHKFLVHTIYHFGNRNQDPSLYHLS